MLNLKSARNKNVIQYFCQDMVVMEGTNDKYQWEIEIAGFTATGTISPSQ